MKALQAAILSLFTQNIMAKFVAVLIASVTIYLIDRAQNEQVDWLTRDLKVMTAEEFDASGSDEPVVVLHHDAATRFLEWPDSIRIQVRGPSKSREEFLRRPLIELRGQRTWTAAGEQTKEAVSRTLQPVCPTLRQEPV